MVTIDIKISPRQFDITFQESYPHAWLSTHVYTISFNIATTSFVLSSTFPAHLSLYILIFFMLQTPFFFSSANTIQSPYSNFKRRGYTPLSISYSPHIRVFSVSPMFFIPLVIKQLYKRNTCLQRIIFSFITCTMLISLFRVSEMSEYLSIS